MYMQLVIRKHENSCMQEHTHESELAARQLSRI